jgi:hypothetical protein
MYCSKSPHWKFTERARTGWRDIVSKQLTGLGSENNINGGLQLVWFPLAAPMSLIPPTMRVACTGDNSGQAP